MSTCATDILIDHLGVGIACSRLPWARQFWETCRRIDGKPGATVLSHGDRLRLAAAPFVTSTFGHLLEFDDANPLIHGHPGAEPVPSLMTTAECEHRSDRDFLIAFGS